VVTRQQALHKNSFLNITEILKLKTSGASMERSVRRRALLDIWTYLISQSSVRHRRSTSHVRVKLLTDEIM
jgi:hypothetical protein